MRFDLLTKILFIQFQSVICSLFALFDLTAIATSSIKLDILMFAYLCLFFIFENKNRIYIENKMSEINDFCGISVRTTRAACFFIEH